ncbi:hypothetical protein F4821DRAFT_143963 [Hypoxylon rubiginosum]|uniref:Uncharacterized protein n=1 Tax=Hypoxylon rubiginosum TaxID=110542 RepID=A0ACC0CZW7_9PEZI|nr:hypothetical protein F4821DRAFT_143963 [Hypoxylon rubiginosum]
MARPRAPKPSAIACAVARILGMGASVVLLANLIYESVNWGKTLGLSITAAVIALVVDGSELMGLLDSTRTIPRVSASYVVCGDMLVLCLAIPSTFLIILSSYDGYSSVDPDPWESADTLSLNVTIAICCLRFILLIWSCVDCCYVTRQHRHPEERMAYVDSSGELRDVRPIS